jgi:hypothetical protein
VSAGQRRFARRLWVEHVPPLGLDDTWADLCDRLEETVLGELHTFDLGKEGG